MRARVSRGVLSTAVGLMAAEAAGSRAVASDGLGSTRAALTPTNRFEEVLSDAERTSRKGQKPKLGEFRYTMPISCGGIRLQGPSCARHSSWRRTSDRRRCATTAQHVRWLIVRLSWFVKLFALGPGGKPYLALSLEIIWEIRKPRCPGIWRNHSLFAACSPLGRETATLAANDITTASNIDV